MNSAVREEDDSTNDENNQQKDERRHMMDSTRLKATPRTPRYAPAFICCQNSILSFPLFYEYRTKESEILAHNQSYSLWDLAKRWRLFPIQ